MALCGVRFSQFLSVLIFKMRPSIPSAAIVGRAQQRLKRHIYANLWALKSMFSDLFCEYFEVFFSFLFVFYKVYWYFCPHQSYRQVRVNVVIRGIVQTHGCHMPSADAVA